LHGELLFPGFRIADRLLQADLRRNVQILHLPLLSGNLLHVLGQLVQADAETLNLLRIDHVLRIRLLVFNRLTLLGGLLLVPLLSGHLASGSKLLRGVVLLRGVLLLWVVGIALSLDLRQQIPLVSDEKWVLKNLISAAFFLEFVKIVHVELANEGREVIVLEILWQNLVTEQIGLFNLESFSGWGPTHDVQKLRATDDLKDLNQKLRNMVN
jgi:hypothetical protein